VHGAATFEQGRDRDVFILFRPMQAKGCDFDGFALSWRCVQQA